MNSRLIACSGILMALAFTCGAAKPPRESLADFPRTALSIQSGDKLHRFEVWVADTTQRRSQGLMFVKQLSPNKGMLFLFEEAQPIAMWMKNTFIPLDMLFIATDGRIIRIAQNTTPHSLATIASMGPASAVLEISGGEAARLGLSVGDRIQHAAFTSP